MGSDDTPGGFSDPGPVTWKEGRKPKKDEAPSVRRLPQDDEWEALAKQVESELEEDVGDEATELYDELNLEADDDEGSEPEVVVVSAQVASQTFDNLAYEPEAELDIDSEEVGIAEISGLVELGDPLQTEDAPEIDLDDPLSEEIPTIDWHGLQAASVLVNLVPRTWKVLAGFWPFLLIAALGGGAVGSFGVDDLWWILLFIGSGAWSTLIHYITLRYRVHDGRLEIHEGLLNKRKRLIDPARIQNVGLVRNVFHRMAGLVEVRLETAGEARTEGMLSALSEQDATELIEVLNALRGRASTPEPADEDAVVSLGVGELLAFGLSRARVGVIGVLLIVGFEVIPLLSPEQTEATLDTLQPGVVVGLVLLAFAVSWAGSGFLAVLRHHGFTLFREQDRLRSREGLLTERKVEIPISKIQLVLADEPLVRRWMGFGTLSVETAGLGSVQEGVQAAELTIPMVDQSDLARVVKVAVPPVEVDPWRDRLAPPHPRALYRMIIGGLAKWTLIAVPCAVFLPPWGYAALALPVLSILANVLDYKYQGWIVTPHAVIARRGFWRRRTWVLARDKIQSVHLVQGPLMRWHGLGRLAVMVAGSSVVLPDVGWPVAEGLLDELKPIPEIELS
ncbi:MAG: PH domain-containing protein [Proteobacteria bacterium]|nr:PH domain-containing protein [Pseudomonadota bacterium]